VAQILDELLFLFSRLDWLGVVDILLVALAIYSLLALARGTQAVVLLRGILFLVIVIALLTTFLSLPAFSWLLRNTLPALLISIPVIFAPEIRRALERLGRAGAVLQISGQEASFQKLIEALAVAAQRLSERRHGGLIVIERQVGLKDYTDTGITLEADISVELLLQIFYPNTPLHDGAVILKDFRIKAAACVMPLSSGQFVSDRQIGLRHRAALGITEASDAVAVIVSEETGMISVAHNGRMIRRLDVNRLKHILAAFYRPRGNPTFTEWVRQRVARITGGEVFPGTGKEAPGD